MSWFEIGVLVGLGAIVMLLESIRKSLSARPDLTLATLLQRISRQLTLMIHLNQKAEEYLMLEAYRSRFPGDRDHYDVFRENFEKLYASNVDPAMSFHIDFMAFKMMIEGFSAEEITNARNKLWESVKGHPSAESRFRSASAK